MNGKQLRASILQEAFTGRLVPQDPNDEPACELLKRIDPKATPLQTDQPLPQGWCATTVSVLCKMTDGKFVKDRELATLDAKVLRGQQDGNKRKSGKLIPAKSLLILVVGENSGEVFRTPIDGYQGASFKKLDINENMHEEFVLQVLNSHHATLKKDRKGTATPFLNRELFRGMQVLVPPLAEQKRIVAKIEELMPLVDEYEKAQEEFDNLNAGLKNKLRASLLQEAIAGRLVPQDPNDEPASKLLKRINPEAEPLQTDQPLPQGWCTTTLSDTCTTINGLWKGKKGPFVSVGVIRNANFTKDFKLDYSRIQHLDVEQKSFAKRKLLDGDLIVEKSGGGDKTPVGRAILYEGENGIYSFSNFTMLLRIRNKAEILPKYIYYFLLCKYRSGAMFGMQTQTTGLRNLETDKYLSMPIPLPPLAEQKRIVEKLESLFAVLDSLDKIVA